MDRFAADPAALIGLMAGLALTLVWSTAELLRMLREPFRPTALGAYGALVLLAVWLVLAPFDALGRAAVDPAVADGLAQTAALQWFACALFCGLAARSRRGAGRWILAGAALLILGELTGWGQAIASLRSPDRRLVEPYSLFSLVPTPVTGAALRALGWAIIGGALACRYLRTAARRPVADDLAAWINRSRLGLPLALTAGTLLQHPALSTAAAIAVSATALHAAAFIALRTGPASGRIRLPARPFVRRTEVSAR